MNERQTRLKAEILAGGVPIVENCSSTSKLELFTCGDLQVIGYMTKHYTHGPDGEVDGWDRHYHGPNPVRIKTTGGKTLRTIYSGTTI